PPSSPAVPDPKWSDRENIPWPVRSSHAVHPGASPLLQPTPVQSVATPCPGALPESAVPVRFPRPIRCPRRRHPPPPSTAPRNGQRSAPPQPPHYRPYTAARRSQRPNRQPPEPRFPNGHPHRQCDGFWLPTRLELASRKRPPSCTHIPPPAGSPRRKRRRFPDVEEGRSPPPSPRAPNSTPLREHRLLRPVPSAGRRTGAFARRASG